MPIMSLCLAPGSIHDGWPGAKRNATAPAVRAQQAAALRRVTFHDILTRVAEAIAIAHRKHREAGCTARESRSGRGPAAMVRRDQHVRAKLVGRAFQQAASSRARYPRAANAAARVLTFSTQPRLLSLSVVSDSSRRWDTAFRNPRHPIAIFARRHNESAPPLSAGSVGREASQPTGTLGNTDTAPPLWSMSSCETTMPSRRPRPRRADTGTMTRLPLSDSAL